jgi:hypothetical protein
MRHLWTTSERLFARAIRWGASHDCSHYALEFFSNRGPDALVIESRFPKGIRIKRAADFFAENIVIHELPVKGVGPAKELAIFIEIAGKWVGQVRYDWIACAFHCLMVARKLAFGTPLPKTNPWGRDAAAYCNEIPWLIDDDLPAFDGSGCDSDATLPHCLYKIMLKQRADNAS